jgi:hypothetical protein
MQTREKQDGGIILNIFCQKIWIHPHNQQKNKKYQLDINGTALTEISLYNSICDY